MKTLLILVTLIGFSFAQDSTGIQPEFQMGIAKASFDGNLNTGDFAFGAVYYTPQAIVDPGLFVTTNIDLNGSNEELLRFGAMVQVQFLRAFSLGVYYDFWFTNIGIVGQDKSNSGFMFSYNVDL